jgi:hypothetical protein
MKKHVLLLAVILWGLAVEWWYKLFTGKNSPVGYWLFYQCIKHTTKKKQ